MQLIQKTRHIGLVLYGVMDMYHTEIEKVLNHMTLNYLYLVKILNAVM